MQPIKLRVTMINVFILIKHSKFKIEGYLKCLWWNLFKLFYKLQWSRSRDRINEVGPGTEFKESELRRWTTCRLIFLIAGSKVKSQEEFEWMIQIWTDGTQFSDPSKSCNWIPGLKLIFIVNLKLRALNLKA